MQNGIIGEVSEKNGAPGGIRTPNLLIRSQVLYPVELRAHRLQNDINQVIRLAKLGRTYAKGFLNASLKFSPIEDSSGANAT